MFSQYTIFILLRVKKRIIPPLVVLSQLSTYLMILISSLLRIPPGWKVPSAPTHGSKAESSP